VIVPPSPIHRLGSRGEFSFSDFTLPAGAGKENSVPRNGFPGQRPQGRPLSAILVSQALSPRPPPQHGPGHPSPRSLSPRPSTARPATARAELASWPRSPRAVAARGGPSQRPFSARAVVRESRPPSPRQARPHSAIAGTNRACRLREEARKAERGTRWIEQSGPTNSEVPPAGSSGSASPKAHTHHTLSNLTAGKRRGQRRARADPRGAGRRNRKIAA